MRRVATVVTLAAALAMAVITASATPALAAGGAGYGSGPGGGSSYYLALGDSLSVGVQPNAAGVDEPTDQGYPDQLYDALQSSQPGLRLVKLGCPGETTATMISGGICGYPVGPAGTAAGSQLSAAAGFLHQYAGRVSLVTIDIGANDLNPCIALAPDAGQVAACVEHVAPVAAANLTTIMAGLRAAGGADVRIIGMTYYDPELADWLTGSAGQAFARLSVHLLSDYNGYLASVYRKFGASVADVFGAFHTTDFTDQATLPNVGTVPLNVALICSWTWECAPPPQGPDEHANAAGYAVIARTFLAADSG
jgi:lysophospholipase L1-like esterase